MAEWEERLEQKDGATEDRTTEGRAAGAEGRSDGATARQKTELPNQDDRTARRARANVNRTREHGQEARATFSGGAAANVRNTNIGLGLGTAGPAGGQVRHVEIAGLRRAIRIIRRAGHAPDAGDGALVEFFRADARA